MGKMVLRVVHDRSHTGGWLLPFLFLPSFPEQEEEQEEDDDYQDIEYIVPALDEKLKSAFKDFD